MSLSLFGRDTPVRTMPAPLPSTPLANLSQQLGKLSASDQEFARSLLSQAEDRGLSAKQTKWVDRLIAKAADAPAAAIGDMRGLIALLDTAGAKLTRPKLIVKCGDLTLRISVAGAGSRTPGAINITSADSGFDSRLFYGRVHRDGRFEEGRDINRTNREAILQGLRDMAANPARTASAYGKLTGHCCFCSLPLTDERSVEMGYGSTCAANYSLPWGARKTA